MFPRTKTRTDGARRARAAALLLAAAALPGCASGGAAPAPAASARAKLGPDRLLAIVNGYTAGFTGLRRKFWEQSGPGFQRAFSFNPTDDVAAYLAALSYAKAGNASATLEWLNELWRLDSCLLPQTRTFGPFLDDPRFGDVRALLRAQAPKSHRSSVAFTLEARGLVPGDLAWDPAARVFYVASLHERRIVRVTPGAAGAPASMADFSRAGDLDAVLGVKVDAPRGRLWAVTAADPAMEGFRPEDFGRSQLVAFDLASGSLLGRWSPMTKGPHQFGGLAVDAAGNVWIADTASGEVHVLRAGGEELAAVAPKGTFIAPKSVAVSPDGARVWVSDLARGVYLLDPATGSATVLDQPPGPWPAGLDGLVVHRNALVGVVGTLSLGRVGRFTLEADGRSFSAAETLDCAHPAFRVPAGGTLVGDDYVYVANSQVDAVGAGGTLPPRDDLQDLVVLRVPIGR